MRLSCRTRPRLLQVVQLGDKPSPFELQETKGRSTTASSSELKIHCMINKDAIISRTAISRDQSTSFAAMVNLSIRYDIFDQFIQQSYRDLSVL